MRIAFIGASNLGVTTARIAIERGHDVIIVERDRERIDALEDELDCGFIHGDGSKPAILREVEPKDTQMLVCLGADDQDNILASLVGRSLGFERVITKITDPEFDYICAELGLEETIIPDDTMARTVADMMEGRDPLSLSNIIRGDVRLFRFVAGEDDAGPAGELELPGHTKAVLLYRDNEPIVVDPETEVRKGDEVVLLTRHEHLEALRERWHSELGAR